MSAKDTTVVVDDQFADDDVDDSDSSMDDDQKDLDQPSTSSDLKPSSAPQATLASAASNRQMNIEIASAASSHKLPANGLGSSSKAGSSVTLFRRSSNSGVESNKITVTWRNLTYTVEKKQFDLFGCFKSDDDGSEGGMIKTSKKTILKGINGQFRTGHLTGVMGPSGSGKSTMLECIVGFRKQGLSGEIKMNSFDPDNVKVALIAQSDYLIEMFTVREMMVYASRLKNHGKKLTEEEVEDPPLEEVVTISGSVPNLAQVDSSSKGALLPGQSAEPPRPKKLQNYHQRLANGIIHQLGLDVCADNRAGSCSGGQKKRISIALEMISKPNILILDEPTSGLDSSACYQTVSVMKRLTTSTQYPVAVVATIHQPSARVFTLFDHIYILSYNGYCIYEGSPTAMLSHLSGVDLTCPQFYNPADFIAEVASGEHGEEVVERLIDVKQRQDATLPDADGSERTLAQYSEMNDYPTLLHTWILIQRTTLQILRDPMLNTMRLASHVLTAFFIGILYGTTIGKPSLCPPLESPLNDLENFPTYRQHYQSEMVTSTENLAFIFFTLMFSMFGAMMPTIMTFPANLYILRKEKINGWYSVAAYYVALSLSEIPFQIFYPATFVAIAYFMTGQLLEWDRFFLFLFVSIIMAFVAQSQGLLIGAIFMSDASAAVFLGPITTVPIMLFGGFFVRLTTVPYYLRFFSYISYLRYAFELSVMIIYGFERCKFNPDLLNLNNTAKPEWMGFATMVLGEGGEKFIDSFARSLGGTYDPMSGRKYQSSLLNQFDISEDYFYYNIAVLIFFFLFLRILTYMVLNYKISKRS